jgi:mannose-6-phosphate isomerase-like protein (cupin superfamily)
MHIGIIEALKALKTDGNTFKQLFKRGSLSVEAFQPKKVDTQQPHTQDEIYIIMAGEGVFNLAGKKIHFNTGDFIFVPAGVSYHFEEFSDNFCTWVIFYGPEGGEKSDI